HNRPDLPVRLHEWPGSAVLCHRAGRGHSAPGVAAQEGRHRQPRCVLERLQVQHVVRRYYLCRHTRRFGLCALQHIQQRRRIQATGGL
ncbi:hypothetical protein LPJ57_010005, partial [Coemansia sp. RSA 486]